jgi:putative NIF3 family GTP cyclohydrolase 1 type 2
VPDSPALSASPQSATPAQAQAPAAQRAREFSRRFPLHTGPVTALQFVQRICEKAALPTAADMEDYVVAGDPTTPVTGIATTAMASLDCLNAAAKSGKNLVVTSEPTFWADGDNLNRLEGNVELKAKRDFIRAHNLVCFHLHDHWPADGPNGIAVGMARELGWENHIVDQARPTHFKLPPTTLLELAKDLSTRLNDRTMRIIGDPHLPVANVAATWGKASQLPTIHLLNEPVDTVIVGYTHEWESVEYVQDMISTGQKKSMILLGESRAEQAGMKYCAEWLKTFISEVPVGFIPVIEPYWNLHNPTFEITSVQDM